MRLATDLVFCCCKSNDVVEWSCFFQFTEQNDKCVI